MIAQYVDTGKVRYVYREFPLTSIHPAASEASEAAVCAGQQGQYWEMNDHLFANQDDWSQSEDPTTRFKAYAEELGLDTGVFDECLDSGEAAVVVQGDLLAGEMMGVNATPYFFIGDLPIRGGLPVEALGPVIDYAAAGEPLPEIVPPLGDWHLRGDPQTAGAITVAFVDFASPEAGAHAREVFPKLAEQYIDGGDLVYVLHPWSSGEDSAGTQAAVAAECAGQQGQYWEMHTQLFEQQEEWLGAAEPRSLFLDYAGSLGLDAGEFETCLDSESARLRVLAGNVVGALYGVPGAPVFLFNNGQGLQGAPTLEEFQSIIDSIISP